MVMCVVIFDIRISGFFELHIYPLPDVSLILIRYCYFIILLNKIISCHVINVVPNFGRKNTKISLYKLNVNMYTYFSNCNIFGYLDIFTYDIRIKEMVLFCMHEEITVNLFCLDKIYGFCYLISTCKFSVLRRFFGWSFTKPNIEPASQ